MLVFRTNEARVSDFEVLKMRFFGCFIGNKQDFSYENLYKSLFQPSFSSKKSFKVMKMEKMGFEGDFGC